MRDDLHSEGGRLALEGHRQCLGADDLTVEPSDHVGGQCFLLHDAVVVIVYGDRTTGRVKVCPLWVGQRIRKGLHLNGVGRQIVPSCIKQ